MRGLAERRARLGALYLSAPRDVYFEAVRAATTEYYLADPSNPYQQSGRSSGAQRWAETRQCIVQAVHRDGEFLDVGCANGLLLESLIGWAAGRGVALRPHGIDFVPELVELARERLARHVGTFEVANAFYWTPTRQFDFVRTNLEPCSTGGLAGVHRSSVRRRLRRRATDRMPLPKSGRREDRCARAVDQTRLRCR